MELLTSRVGTKALGLHSRDRPAENEDEDEEGATALSSHNSTVMDPEHAELVKRAKEVISNTQWEDVVQKALRAWQVSPACQ